MLHILALFSFLLVSSSHAAVQDFCVADLTAPQGPAGYSCKTPTEVTADDFVYSGLSQPGNTSSLFNAAINTAFVDKFPGLNGLGLSMARADIAPGGVVPMHTHHGASETILIAKGSITAGFISSDNTVNTGRTHALVWVTFGSSNPGIQILSNALFSNNLPSELIEKTTFIDDDEVKRLKALLGGSG
ncbi:hypothetical protein AAG906_022834 [Vitis piasezkii]